MKKVLCRFHTIFTTIGMATKPADMVDLSERDKDVLVILSGGRANPMLIRDRTDLDKGDVNTVLVKLTRDGLARRVARGLYEITPDGWDELDDSDVTEAGLIENVFVRQDAEDVVSVEFIGERSTVTVSVTDETMNMFVAAAEDTHRRIHGKMAEMRGIFDSKEADDE